MSINLIQAGAEMAIGRLVSHASRPVIYRRGSTSLPLSAVPARSAGIQDAGGIVLRAWDRDWIVRVADLGGLGKPADGDELVDGAVVYRVMPAAGVPSFEYLDAGRTAVRLHTKVVSES